MKWCLAFVLLAAGCQSRNPNPWETSDWQRKVTRYYFRDYTVTIVSKPGEWIYAETIERN